MVEGAPLGRAAPAGEKGGAMLYTTFLLLVSGTFFMLRLGTNTGSFPRPLDAAEESKLIQRWSRATWKRATSSSSTICAWWRTS